MAQQPPEEPRFRALIDRAASEGRVPVLIQVHVALEDRPGTPLREQQYASIATAQRPVVSALKALGGTAATAYETIPFIAAPLTADGLRRIRGLRSVARVYEDGMRGLAVTETRNLVGAVAANNNGITGAKQHWNGIGSHHIAVIDSGVDQAHPFLPRVSGGACFSQTTTRYWSTCPGGVNSESGSAGRACGYSGCDHGTHVAGIAAGVAGMAPGAGILPVNVASYDSQTGRLVFFDSDILRAIEYVLRRHESLRASLDEEIAAVNLSLGGGGFTASCDGDLPYFKNAFDILRSAGIVTVIASGNDGYTNAVSAPACISSAVSVGSTTKADGISAFTNSSAFLLLVAPGSSVYSSVPGGGYAFKSGTSMAAPHVAGAWALFKQVASRATVGDVLAMLRQTGRPVYDSGNGLTFPRIQIDGALTMLAPQGDLLTILFNFDGDAYKDVFLYDGRTGHWSIKRGSSTGVFNLGPSGQWAGTWKISVADFNGDGLDDLFLYAPSTGQYTKLINVGGQVFSGFSQGWQSGFDVHIVDFNGDGKADVFVYNPVTGVWFTCISTGDGTAGFSYVSGQWAASWRVLAGDFNGDGKTDLFLYSQVSGLYYKVIGVGDGRLTYTDVGVWALTWTPYIGDLNGDGRSDVFLYDAANGLWYRCISTGDGTGPFAYTVGQWAPGYALQVADFNADGTSDLFLYNRTSGLWYKALSSASGFTYPQVGTWSAWNTTVSDMQRDGRSDLFLYNPASRVWYWAVTPQSDSGSFTYVSGSFASFERY